MRLLTAAKAACEAHDPLPWSNVVLYSIVVVCAVLAFKVFWDGL